LRRRYFVISVLFLLAVSAVLSLHRFYSVKHSGKKLPDLGAIRKRGRLIAVTDYNSIDYFIYKGTPMGFNYELLNSFSDFTGIDLEIIAENDIDRAAAIVSSGKADLLASGIAGTYPGSRDLKAAFPVDTAIQESASQDLSWAVRKENSDTLMAELNRWISSCRNTGSYAILHSKYFNTSWSSIILNSDYYANNTGRVSRYDDIIRKFSATIGWDWRLVASLICQESRFRPDVVSSKGAYGLMQVMPVTGKDFGIDITVSPENNIRAGIMYLKWLISIFETKVPDENERLNFVLASYNAGPGHVLDAMRLAKKNGMDPCKWEGNVALWLLKKSEPEYYNDSVVKNGYFRGRESVKFVTEVLTRFGHYKNIIPEEQARSF
jgi:membrane-bound lytic murein transglycosylase MltF